MMPNAFSSRTRLGRCIGVEQDHWDRAVDAATAGREPPHRSCPAGRDQGADIGSVLRCEFERELALHRRDSRTSGDRASIWTSPEFEIVLGVEDFGAAEDPASPVSGQLRPARMSSATSSSWAPGTVPRSASVDWRRRSASSTTTNATSGVVAQIVVCDGHAPTAESEQIGQGDVSTDLQTMLTGGGRRLEHRHRAAGGGAAGDALKRPCGMSLRSLRTSATEALA